MNAQSLINKIKGGALDEKLVRLYGKNALEGQKERYIKALGEFAKLFGEDREASVFSVPGRSEISGNHTDHNFGCVIAGSVDLDIIAVAAKRDDNVLYVKSEGHDADIVDVKKYTTPDEKLFGQSASLLAGVSKGLENAGYKVGGLDAYTTSCVPGGSGLSSSAAFENMIGTMINHFYNDGKVSSVEIAKISQFAENVFFAKPCGLMD